MKLIKITSSLLLAGALATSLQAKEIDVYAGYSSGQVDNQDTSGATVGIAMRVDMKKFQTSWGLETNFLGKNDNASDGSGNTGLAFFSEGYKVTDKIIPYALVGFAFQDLGTDDSGASNLASGFAYGAGVRYKLSESFSFDLNYKAYSLSDTNDYSYDVNLLSGNVVWKFKTFK